MEPLTVQEMEPKFKNEMDKFYKSKCHCTYAHFGDKKYTFQRDIYKTIERQLRSVEIRNDDIWIGGFSRSGTHWLSELAWLLTNNLDYGKAKNIDIEERVLFFDFQPSVMKSQVDDNKINLNEYTPKTRCDVRPSPRYFKTHFPLSLLPPGLLDTAKMVYIARDPRDVAVSFYHFHKKHSLALFSGDFKVFWNHFKNGCVMYCPYFSNVKEYWGLRNHPNLLFLFYEEMYEDLPNTARRVAQFFGREYTEEKIQELCEYLNFNNMKKNKAVNFDPMLGDDCQQVVRKGKAGGWREEFDEELTREAEQWIAENLKDSDLKYPSMS